MTREEAITLMKSAQLLLVNPRNNKPISDLYEALDMSIKALEQEPCEDCISRSEVILSMKKLYEQDCKDYGCEIPECFDADRAIRELKSLPSVQPKPKTGRWVGIDEEPHEDYECNRCGYVCSTFTANIKPSEEYKYCPNCGADMRGEENGR